MIKFDKDEFLKPQIYSTNDEYKTRCNVNKEIVDDVKKLQQENQSLKKQLETYEIEGYEQNEELNKMSFDIRKYKIQQKEFIDYLENEKDRLARECSHMYKNSLGKTRLVNEDIFNEVDTILLKYKEIIGGKEE